MDIVIISGMSGAGKSHAVNTLEDIGYYCVDNMPPMLLAKFIELSRQNEQGINKIAVVVDSRGGKMFDAFCQELDELEKAKIPYRLLFLDSADAVIFRRFKETRRKHPLISQKAPSLESAISLEREMLAAVRSRASYVIDTTHLLPMQLKEKISSIFLEDRGGGMLITCLSFGFKYGYPSEADLMFDVRCLPNPFYIEELRPKTGVTQEVRDYVMSFPQSETLLDKLKDLVDFLIPHYITEGKTQLVIALGCTGGKHRSITFAELLYQHLLMQEFNLTLQHRDIEK